MTQPLEFSHYTVFLNDSKQEAKIYKDKVQLEYDDTFFELSLCELESILNAIRNYPKVAPFIEKTIELSIPCDTEVSDCLDHVVNPEDTHNSGYYYNVESRRWEKDTLR